MSLSLRGRAMDATARLVPSAGVGPRDRYHLVYAIMAVLGAGLLWPYNTIISVPEYFAQAYPGKHAQYVLPAILSYPSLIFLAIMVRFGPRVSFSFRIVSCFSVMAFLVAGVPLIAYVESEWSFQVLCALVFVLGVCLSIIQSSVFAFASKLPPLYTQAVMSGQGVAGIGVCLLRILTKFMYPPTPSGIASGTMVFIFISAAISLVSVIAYAVAIRQPFTRHHLSESAPSSPSQSRASSDIPVSGFDFVKESSLDPLEQSTLVPVGDREVRYLVVLRKLWANGLVVATVFMVTFLAFPGLTSELRSSTGIDQSWFTLLLITAFNAMDAIGRTLPGWFVAVSPRHLAGHAVVRFALYPAFIACKAGVAFNNDAWIVVLIALLAFTNGYYASIGMMNTTLYVEPHENEAAGAIMSFFLMAGIIAGMQAAIILRPLLPA